MTPRPAGMRSFVTRTIDGSYELLGFLAEGGFGAVYRSEQIFLGRRLRRVAVKVSKHPAIETTKLREQLADVYVLAEAIDELTDAEARGHLVQIFDAGIWEEEQRAYVVMEFIQGRPLDAVLDSYRPCPGAPASQIRVPENIVCDWARQLSRTLGELHSLVPPVLHRDLKPSNILLEHDQHIRVVDFGLAARLIQQGYVPGTAGTTAYMAPEVMMGESVPASDVYSMGLILYEALTGILPFAHLIAPTGTARLAEVPWLYQQKSKIPAIPPSQYNSTVSKEMDRIVLRCLEFDPCARYLTASDLLKDLERGAELSKSRDEIALEQHRKNSSQGRGSCQALEQAAALSFVARQATLKDLKMRFTLLRELGECLIQHGDANAGAQRLVEAWELIKGRPVLLGDDRQAFRKKIAEAWQVANNRLQEDLWRNIN